MAAPAWFNKQYYIANKIAELKADGYGDYTPLSLAAAMKESGYSTTDDGYYQHFLDHGKYENVSPTPYFDPNYYFQSKAASYFGKDISLVTESEVLFIKSAFQKANLSAWDHYLKYGMSEGIDPSADFSTEKYLTAKLAQLNELDPDTYGSWTISDVANAFTEVGLTAFEHYFKYGQSEGLTISPADHGYVVQSLTSDIDNLSGTLGYPDVDESTGDLTINDAYSDYFLSEVGTLQSADAVDGLAGDDTFYARVVGDPTNDGSAGSKSGTALEPTIKNVETILFRSEVPSDSIPGYVNYDSQTDYSGEVLYNTSANKTFYNNKVVSYIDADRFELADGEKLTIGSDNSRADLSIEDIRHNSNETIIRFADADPGVNFWVYFDPQHLTSEAAEQQGYINVELMDVNHADKVNGTGHPLETNPYNQFRFAYVHGSTTDIITLSFRSEDASLYTGADANYSTLLTAFQHALEDFESANEAFKGVFTIEPGGNYTATAYSTTDGITYSATGTYVKISTDNGSVNCDVDGTGWMTNGVVPANTWYDTKVNNESSVDCPLIVVSVELDNVGRVDWKDMTECLPNDIIYGSNAGDLQIGSMALRGGIERMDVLVDRGSWLNGLYSTNDTLRMVTVTASDINGDSVAGNSADEVGQLYIGAWNSRLDDNGNDAANNTTQYRHLTWTDPASLLYADGSTTGLKDVAVFDAASYAGDINIAAAITEDSYDKYLKSVDGQRNFASDSKLNYSGKVAPLSGYDGNFTYNTGTGDDVVNMTVAGDIAADVDFNLVINTGDGADLVAFRYDDMSVNQSLNQKYMQNATINVGSGDDTVWFYADADLGNEYLYFTKEYTHEKYTYQEDLESYTVYKTSGTYTLSETLCTYIDDDGNTQFIYLQSDGETYLNPDGTPVEVDLSSVTVTTTTTTRETTYTKTDEGYVPTAGGDAITETDTRYEFIKIDPDTVGWYYKDADENYVDADGNLYEGDQAELIVVTYTLNANGNLVNAADATDIITSDDEKYDEVRTANGDTTVYYMVEDEDGAKQLISEDGTVTYSEDDDMYQTIIDGAVSHETTTYIYDEEQDVYVDKNDKTNTISGEDTVIAYFNEEDVTTTYHLINGSYVDANGNVFTGDPYDLVSADSTRGISPNPAGSVKINGDDGADVIYANQLEFFTGGAQSDDESGVTLGADNYNAVFIFNAPVDRSVGVDGFDGATLNNDVATGVASFALSQDNVSSSVNHLYVTVNFKGFEAEAEIKGLSVSSSDGNSYYTVNGSRYLSAEQINHAIIDAIEDDTTAMHGHALSDLLAAKDGAGHSLLIESKINGAMDTDDLTIGFEYRANSTVISENAVNTSSYGVDMYATNFATFENETANSDGIATTETLLYDGTLLPTSLSQVTVNGGTGNDLIVLGNNDLRDVVTLSGNFGNDTIVDFEAGIDQINYSSYISGRSYNGAYTSLLANQTSIVESTASTESQIAALATNGTLAFNTSAAVSSKALVFLHTTADDTTDVYTAVLLTKTTAANSTTSPNASTSVLGTLTFAEDTCDVNAFQVALTGSTNLVDDPDLVTA